MKPPLHTQSLQHKGNNGLLVLSLLLGSVHMLVGFFILLVASWFIAASSIAGLGFNYMLPAVVIRALAILRIGSGYFSMLTGHDFLLKKLSDLRLALFASLKNKTHVSRKASLDALSHQTEEVAAVWMSWVSSNAGIVLSLISVQVGVLFLLPTLGSSVALFIFGFTCIYILLLLAMLKVAAQITEHRQHYQLALAQHIEAAPIWHMQRNYHDAAPKLHLLRASQDRLQWRIRIGSLALFLLSIATISVVTFHFASVFLGNPLFVMLPMALLTINDWLTPALHSQLNLVQYFQAKQQLHRLSQGQSAERNDTPITQLSIREFYAEDTHMNSVSASFLAGNCHVVMGSSGSGKSRLLMAISGLLPFKGMRRLNENEPNLSSQNSATGILNHALYIEQFPYCLADTLRSNLTIANTDSSDPQLKAVLSDVGLGHLNNLEQWLGDNGRQLSGGEKKRLGIARAMLSEANVLLFDEPFEALDEENILRITTILNALSKHKIVILSTHILPPSLQCSQQIQLDDVNSSCAGVPSAAVLCCGR